MVEKVVKITKKGQSYQVLLSNKEKIAVSEEILVRHRLLKDTEVTEELLATIRQESAWDLGYQLSLRYLSYQLRSEKEIKDYLIKQEIEPQFIPKIIQKLKELKLLDDQMYANSYVRTMIKTGDKGPNVISQQLKKRGIDEFKIMEALTLFTPEAELSIATKRAEKMIRQYHQKNHKEIQRKIYENLLKKGFHKEVIEVVMAELPLEKDSEHEWEILQKQADKLWERNRRFPLAKRKQKTFQSLFQKGYEYEMIQRYIQEKEMTDEEEN